MISASPQPRRTWALAGGTALLGAGLLVAGAVSRTLWYLSLAYLLVGLGGAYMNTTSSMWLAAHVKKDVAAPALAMILFFGLGMVITPVVIGQVIDRSATWRWILVAEGGIALTTALVLACLPLLDILGRQNVRLSHLRQVVAHDPRLLLGMLGAGLMYTGTETTINVWLPKFQIDVFSTSDTWASLAVTLFWVGLVVGRLIVMPLTRRFAPSQTTSLVLSVGAGLGASASYGIIGSYAGRFPEWQSGVVSSLFILSGGIGSIAFPYIMGPLAEAAGFRTALAATALPALLCGLFALSIHSRSEEARA